MEVRTDLHVHTVASGHAFSTVEENARAAAEKGLELIAITDHGPALPGGAHLFHFLNLGALPRRLDGVKILRSAEVNVVDEEGSLDLPDRILSFLDIVHFGFHPGCGYGNDDISRNTEVAIRVISGGNVDVFTHPETPYVPVEMEPVVEAAKECGVLIEVNGASFGRVRRGVTDSIERLVRAAAELGAEVVVGSDAHFSGLVGDFGGALELIERVGMDPEQVVNRTADGVLQYMRRKGKEMTS